MCRFRYSYCWVSFGALTQEQQHCQDWTKEASSKYWSCLPKTVSFYFTKKGWHTGYSNYLLSLSDCLPNLSACPMPQFPTHQLGITKSHHLTGLFRNTPLQLQASQTRTLLSVDQDRHVPVQSGKYRAWIQSSRMFLLPEKEYSSLHCYSFNAEFKL